MNIYLLQCFSQKLVSIVIMAVYFQLDSQYAFIILAAKYSKQMFTQFVGFCVTGVHFWCYCTLGCSPKLNFW